MTAILRHDRRDGFGLGHHTTSSYPLHMPSSSSRISERSQDQAQEDIDQQNSTRVRRNVESERIEGQDEGERQKVAGSSTSNTAMMQDRYGSQEGEERRFGASGSSWTQSVGSAQGAPTSPSTNNGHKRRYSQRSPSRPRSQQGSQAAQIASVKEAEREIAAGGSFVRHYEVAEEEAYDHSRKAPRLSRDKDGASSSDWPRGRTLSQISEADDEKAAMAKMRTSTSRDDDDQDASRRQRSRAYDEDAESNYTWHHRSSDRTRDTGREPVDSSGAADLPNSPPSRFAHMPPSGSRMHAPSSAPPSTVPPPQQLPERDSQDRTPSPPPRLPGIAALGSYNANQHGSHRPPSIASPSQRTDPTSHSYLSTGSQHQSSSGRPRVSSFGVPAYASTSPRGGVPAPSSMSAHSPSLSQTSHTTPGQAFIHPSLAGLPGAGGGAGSKQQPSFVSKLYSMLEDDTIEDMIAWTPSGITFSVANPSEFAKVVLPNWFKHSNWQSFVRQLNMYGFHKVNHTYQGTPEEEIQVWEFKHPSFRRGEVHLLSEIKRKSSRHKRHDSLTRSMNHGTADYEMGQTPSPEMGMQPTMGAGHAGLGGAPHQPQQHPHGYGGQSHQQQQTHMVIHHHGGQPVASQSTYARGGAPTAPYADYGGEHGVAGEPIGARHARSHSHVTAVTQGEMAAARRGDPRVMALQHRDELHASATAGAVEGVGGGVEIRLDDLSDRIDAIIRHASYLEGQVRTVSEQLFHSQQNEASLRTHVHHLESQMRSLSDQLFQQRHTGVAPPPPPPASPSSSSVARMQHHHPSSSAASPNLQQGVGGPSASGRFPPSLSGSAYSSVAAHPSYVSSRGSGGPSTGAYEQVRAPPASSADAYTKLGPPPPPGSMQHPPPPQSSSSYKSEQHQ